MKVPNLIRKLFDRHKLAPHELAQQGKGTWGRQASRQPSDSPAMPAKANPRATISARVIRKDGKVEDLGVISGGKK